VFLNKGISSNSAVTVITNFVVAMIIVMVIMYSSKVIVMVIDMGIIAQNGCYSIQGRPIVMIF
jgi:hypothetical protein